MQTPKPSPVRKEIMVLERINTIVSPLEFQFMARDGLLTKKEVRRGWQPTHIEEHDWVWSWSPAQHEMLWYPTQSTITPISA